MKLKKIGILGVIVLLGLTLGGCTLFDNASLTIDEYTKGLPLTISTYTAQGKKIDQIKTNKAYIHTDRTMSETDSNNNQISKVIDIDYGTHRTTHVGSSMIAYSELKNYVDELSHTNVDTRNQEINDNSIPWLSSIYKDFKNQWSGRDSVLLIRSQTGVPIATFVGHSISLHQTGMKSVTKFIIDKRPVFVYRCDYSTYDMDTIKNMK
ncbi:DUF5052 family protein [Lactobacillus sp. PV037]|uniref:DUF5052 family protein n=1 Tax=Lactobacillus sp. PV037 TaxID=2594496 RepID=UPI00223EBBAE|nr:DUF5052 family protein [Lactobacillus sp. PV037]QNQ83775.1 DUF5052 family protein [Lactobacillus sp. PV037]